MLMRCRPTGSWFQTRLIFASLAIIMRTSIIGVGRRAALLVQLLIENFAYFFEGKPTNLSSRTRASSDLRRRSVTPTQYPSALPQNHLSNDAVNSLPRHHSLPLNAVFNLNAMEIGMKPLTPEEKLERRKSIHFQSPPDPKVKWPFEPEPQEIAKGIAFTFLVRRGENDFPTKVSIICESVEQLRQKLCQRFNVPFDSTILYLGIGLVSFTDEMRLDTEFDEYVRLPNKIEDLPAKAKLVILEPEIEMDIPNHM